MEKEKTNLYILSIVAIVAVVGIVMLIIGSNVSEEVIPLTTVESDVTGQALASAKCIDTDSGFDYTTKGTISGGKWKTTEKLYDAKIDSCNTKGQLQEGFCSDPRHGFYVFKYCDQVVGVGYVCEDGACVPGSCSENLYLGESLTDCEPSVESTTTFVFTQDDADAPVADMYLFIDYTSADEVYLEEGKSYGEFTLDSIENDEYETLEFVTGSTSGEIRFSNNDGTVVELPLAAYSSYTSGEASDESIFWGNEAPSSTTANQNELVYLEGEVCEGTKTNQDCQGAMFLVIDDDFNAHLIQITNIDTTDNEISFDDLTYGTTDDDIIYTDGTVSIISLTSARDIKIIVDETAKTITFTSIGSSDGATIKTENGATLEIVNSDVGSQTFEGLLFSEKNDANVVVSYLEDFEITAAFDDASDNSIEFGIDSMYALGATDGFGLFDEDDTNDDFQKFMTWKGTILTFDIEDRQSLVLEHPESSVYAVVSME